MLTGCMPGAQILCPECEVGWYASYKKFIEPVPAEVLKKLPLIFMLI